MRSNGENIENCYIDLEGFLENVLSMVWFITIQITASILTGNCKPI